METGVSKVGICVDNIGWWVKFEKYARRVGLDYEVFEIERGDWIGRVREFSGVVWRPNLDPPFCEEAKEKIFFMEHFLRKRVFPNWATFWHYDNKRAQAYFFDLYDVATPRTFCSYSRSESLDFIDSTQFPVVSKSTGGAGSEGVRLLPRRDAR